MACRAGPRARSRAQVVRRGRGGRQRGARHRRPAEHRPRPPSCSSRDSWDTSLAMVGRRWTTDATTIPIRTRLPTERGGKAGRRRRRLLACNSQDWGRRFLTSNGGCVYIDLNHLELCLPEVLSAADFVAAWHAMLLVARRPWTAPTPRPAKAASRCWSTTATDRGIPTAATSTFSCRGRRGRIIFHRKPHQMA